MSRHANANDLGSRHPPSATECARREVACRLRRRTGGARLWRRCRHAGRAGPRAACCRGATQPRRGPRRGGAATRSTPGAHRIRCSPCCSVTETCPMHLLGVAERALSSRLFAAEVALELPHGNAGLIPTATVHWRTLLSTGRRTPGTLVPTAPRECRSRRGHRLSAARTSSSARRGDQSRPVRHRGGLSTLAGGAAPAHTRNQKRRLA